MLDRIDLRPDDEVEAPTVRGGLVSFVGHVGRFVRLAERQGTRLVDVLERWAVAAERQAAATERHAVATERLADAIGGADEERR
jgi:hypothetical protein